MPYRRKFLALTLFVSAIPGCFDATPIELPKGQSGLPVEGGIPTDDAGEAGPEYAHPECHACIVAPTDPGPGCGDNIEECKTSGLCMAIFECAYARGCVTKPTRDESMGCALPCANDLGVTDVFGPAIQSAIRLTTCFHSVCASVCEIK